MAEKSVSISVDYFIKSSSRIQQDCIPGWVLLRRNVPAILKEGEELCTEAEMQESHKGGSILSLRSQGCLLARKQRKEMRSNYPTNTATMIDCHGNISDVAASRAVPSNRRLKLLILQRLPAVSCLQYSTHFLDDISYVEQEQCECRSHPCAFSKSKVSLFFSSSRPIVVPTAPMIFTYPNDN